MKALVSQEGEGVLKTREQEEVEEICHAKQSEIRMVWKGVRRNNNELGWGILRGMKSSPIP